MENHSARVPLKREDSMGIPQMDPSNASTPILVGIAGGSASGKTTLCNRIISELGDRNCLVVSLDSFYLGVAPEKAKGYDFDHPDALDWDLCLSVLQKLLNNEEAEIPIYNFATHSREKHWVKLKPCSLILFEGILALHDVRIVKLMNFKIFVSCDDDVRLYRRLVRDVKERERDVGGVLYQYNRFVKPSYADFIKPSCRWANIIVPGNSDNSVAVNFVVENLRSHLYKVEELKSNSANKNFDFMSLLDTCWLNTVADQESELTALFKYNRVLLPVDDYVRNECLNIFNLLSCKFSKTLYTICMSRFITYGVKMLTKLKPKDPKKYAMIHYSSDLADHTESIKEAEIVGIIVPIWDQEANQKIKEKIEALSALNNSLEIFVFAVFADIETMTEMTQGKSNIYVICSLCLSDISNIEPLYGMLKENCLGDYDFNQHFSLINTLQETCERVFKRHSEVLTRIETTHGTEINEKEGI